MAQKVLVSMVDDIDGGPANETVAFGLDGVTYEIDLSDKHAGALRDELAAFVAAAQRTGGRKTRGSAVPAAVPDRERTQATRTWARENGFPISDRGRIPAEVTAAHEEAQRPPKPDAPATPRRRPRKKAAAS